MLFIVFAAGYYLIFMIMFYGLVRTKQTTDYSTNQKASVIICACNEARRIQPLLQSLKKIEYSKENFEVILVNDNSIDETGEIMQAYCAGQGNWRYLFHEKSSDSYKGKKGALDFGIQNSQHDIILATDADCIVPQNWLKSMLSYFDENTALVQGYSPVLKRQDFLSVYQQFDTLAEGVTAASSFFYNTPTHANARNFAFRKSVYHEIGGFSSISHVDTGDDFYLAKLIKNETNYDFRYNCDRNSFVSTHEVDHLKDYWHQQLRRNSKGFDLGGQILFLGSWLIIFHLLLIYLLISGNSGLFGILLSGKFIVEFLPVFIGARKFNEQRVLYYFPILWIIYPVFYFASQFLGSLKIYQWK
jgi:cellulose synthase/poly-beta-1,6-N-acetylglucosamine synthase-like glycosyltransferase